MGSIKKKAELKHLYSAAEDFRYLLNRGYPRKASLELVGNRYRLTYDERHLLHRGVFSDEDSRSRGSKRVSVKALGKSPLAIDGHNVLITVQAALSASPLVMGDDGFVRDISGLSRKFRRTEGTDRAIDLVFQCLGRARPSMALFLFDAPISKSGRLAQEVRERLETEGLPGDARAVDVPEKILIGFPGIVATSDTAIIDRADKVVDLAGHLARRLRRCSRSPSPGGSFRVF